MKLSIIPSLRYLDLNPGEKRVLNRVARIYKSETKTPDRRGFLYIQPRLRKLCPDFILIDTLKGISIIEVKDWSRDYILEMNRVEVRLSYNGRIRKDENPIFKANRYYDILQRLIERDVRLFTPDGRCSAPIYSKVVFSNMIEDDLENYYSYLDQPPSSFVSLNGLKRLSIDTLFGRQMCNIKPEQLQIIRSLIFPEIKVHSSNTRKNAPSTFETIKVLDKGQEAFAKRLPYGHYMVTGVPGSGKTVLLLSRAIYLLRENPDWNILIVTYTNSLANALNNMFRETWKDLDEIGLKYENIQISTFHRLCRKLADMVIPENPHQEFWEKQLPEEALKNAKPTFDAVLIDEYQDFHESWFKLCLKVCKKYSIPGFSEATENLFLAGDRLQRIYKVPWKSYKELGINVQGRSKLLKRSYRTGKGHIDLALEFLMTIPSLKREVQNFYEGEDGIWSERADGEIEFLTGDARRINQALHDLLREGYAPEDILVLVREKRYLQYIFGSLDSELRDKSVVDLKNYTGKQIVITTYHSAKGLENSVCVLVNLSGLPLGNDDATERKLVYVGLTRASKKLILHAEDFSQNSYALELKNTHFAQSK